MVNHTLAYVRAYFVIPKTSDEILIPPNSTQGPSPPQHHRLVRPLAVNVMCFVLCLCALLLCVAADGDRRERRESDRRGDDSMETSSSRRDERRSSEPNIDEAIDPDEPKE